MRLCGDGGATMARTNIIITISITVRKRYEPRFREMVSMYRSGILGVMGEGVHLGGR